MRATSRRIWCLCVLAVVASLSAAMPGQANSKQSTNPILGVWRAQMNGLPMVTLTITDEGGSLAGAALFYLLRRDEKGAVSSSPGIPEPLLDPVFDGKALTFQMSHRRAHPPGSLADPPANFRLTLTGENKGEFINTSEEGSPSIQLVRSEY